MENIDNMPSENEEGFTTFLIFNLYDERYCINVLNVKELCRWKEPTLLPDSSPSTIGVINIRGAVIPLIDLKIKFGLPKEEYDELKTIIVLNNTFKEQERLVAIIVDSVTDTYDINNDDILPAPEITTIDRTFITGSIDFNEHITAIIDPSTILETNIKEHSIT